MGVDMGEMNNRGASSIAGIFAHLRTTREEILAEAIKYGAVVRSQTREEAERKCKSMERKNGRKGDMR